jgi:P4 family phage/plasmid primase-like protien
VRGVNMQPTDLGKPNQQFDKAIQFFTDKKHLAEQFIKIQPLYYDVSKMWWIWNFNLKCWELCDETDIVNLISDTSKADTISSKERTEILEALKQVGRRNKPKNSSDRWIQFKDTIYDLETDKTFPATPEYFITNPIPYNMGETEDTPIMDKIFTEWVGVENKNLLYEIIAFCISNKYFIHRLFVLLGAGSNGKSKFLSLIRKFVGEKNVSSTELDTLLNSRFENTKLFKKLVCVMGETNFNTLSRTSLLKRITGQDLIGFEFKHKLPFDDFNYAKILISTNTLPQTTDKTTGFFRRWSIIDFKNEFGEKLDILSTIPEVEYNNLAKKCIKLLKELMVNNSFTNEGTIEERTKRYEERSNPICRFVKEQFERDINSEFAYWEFKDLFLSFLAENKFRIQNDTEIGRGLVIEGLERYYKNIKKEDGTKTTIRFIRGIKLKNDKNNVSNLSNVGCSTYSLHGEINQETYITHNTHITKPKLGDFIPETLDEV